MKMRAAVNTEYGPPEIVSIKEVEKPVPKDNEILVKIYASTVNRTDCGFRSANYFIVRFFSGLFRPRLKILGSEFAGIVEDCGKSVTSFRKGDRVFGFNDKTFGAHAEYMTIKENDPVDIIPDNFSFEEAAPLTEGAHYALCDIRAAGVKNGHDVLVYGASGAIGSAAVQLLNHFGANVTAVCNTANVDRVKSLGPDDVIDYMNQDFTTIGKVFDFIFDAVGKSSFSQCKPLLKEKGIYISTELGRNSENIIYAIFTPLSGGKKVMFPLPSITRDDVRFIKDLAEKGMFKPLFDRKFSLDQIVEAYTYVETGQKSGNVVISPVSGIDNPGN